MTCQGDRWAVPALPPQQAPSHPEVPPHCPAALGRSGTAQVAWGAWLPTLAPPPAPGRQAQLLSLRAVNWMETRHGVRRQLECLLKNVISFYFPHSALPPFFQTITCSQLLLVSCAAGGDLGAQTSVCVRQLQPARTPFSPWISVLGACSHCGSRRWQSVVWQETAPSKVTHHLPLPRTRIWKPQMEPLRLVAKGSGLLQHTPLDNGG